MNWDIQRHEDRPRLRGMELCSPEGWNYEEDEFRDAVDAFNKLEANEPETVLLADVRHDEVRGRLAVAMAVRGTQVELHGRANEWLGLLGANGSRVGYEWSIGH